MIEVTNIKLNIIKNDKVLAYATVTISDSIVISGIRLYEGKKGKFIIFPGRKSKNGRNFDVVFPIKDKVREEILQKIEKQYLKDIS